MVVHSGELSLSTDGDADVIDITAKTIDTAALAAQRALPEKLRVARVLAVPEPREEGAVVATSTPVEN